MDLNWPTSIEGSIQWHITVQVRQGKHAKETPEILGLEYATKEHGKESMLPGVKISVPRRAWKTPSQGEYRTYPNATQARKACSKMWSSVWQLREYSRTSRHQGSTCEEYEYSRSCNRQVSCLSKAPCVIDYNLEWIEISLRNWDLWVFLRMCTLPYEVLPLVSRN